MENKTLYQSHTAEYISLKEYFDKVTDLLTLSIDLKIKNIATSTELAANALERRLEIMNEFRAALNDAVSRNISRNEFDILHQRVLEDIKILREEKARTEGKASIKSVVIVYAISLIGIALTIISLLN